MIPRKIINERESILENEVTTVGNSPDVDNIGFIVERDTLEEKYPIIENGFVVNKNPELFTKDENSIEVAENVSSKSQRDSTNSTERMEFLNGESCQLPFYLNTIKS